MTKETKLPKRGILKNSSLKQISPTSENIHSLTISNLVIQNDDTNSLDPNKEQSIKETNLDLQPSRHKIRTRRPNPRAIHNLIAPNY